MHSRHLLKISCIKSISKVFINWTIRKSLLWIYSVVKVCVKCLFSTYKKLNPVCTLKTNSNNENIAHTVQSYLGLLGPGLFLNSLQLLIVKSCDHCVAETQRKTVTVVYSYVYARKENKSKTLSVIMQRTYVSGIKYVVLYVQLLVFYYFFHSDLAKGNGKAN